MLGYYDMRQLPQHQRVIDVECGGMFKERAHEKSSAGSGTWLGRENSFDVDWPGRRPDKIFPVGEGKRSTMYWSRRWAIRIASGRPGIDLADNVRPGMIISLRTQELANWRISAGHRHRHTRALTVSSCPWRLRRRACVPSLP